MEDQGPYVPPAAVPPAPPPEAVKPVTNVFAVLSLVLGSFGVCGGWLLGLPFGIVALVQISRSGQGGRPPQGGQRMAIAGVVVSVVWPIIAFALRLIPLDLI